MKGSAVSRRLSEILGFALFAAALLWVVSLASYDPNDPVWFFSTASRAAPANFAGRVGAFLAELSFQLFGYGSYLIPAVLVVIGWHYFWCRSLDAAGTKATGTALLVGCVSALLSLLFGTLEVSGKAFRAGGYAGDWLARELAEYFNRTGSAIVIVTLIFLSVILTTHFSFGRLFRALTEALVDAAGRLVVAIRARREERRRERQRREVLAKHTRKGTAAAAQADGRSVAGAAGAAALAGAPSVAANQPLLPAAPAAGSHHALPLQAAGSHHALPLQAAGSHPALAKSARARESNERAGAGESPAGSTAGSAAALGTATALGTGPAAGGGAGLAGVPGSPGPSSIVGPMTRPPKVNLPALPFSEAEPLTKAPAERRKGDYSMPPLALLDAPKTERKIDERELMDGARLLEEKCREFAVEGAVVQIHPGPVVTTFEFKPDAGVKYSKITNLADDLCLAMQAESVLIDRIPGKSTVGIQIPNRTREQISLRELLESEVYRRSTSKLTLALGKTIHGEPYVADLALMPHLLIAGSTGAGKSVGINAMLTSILYRATPDDVRLILIDPKRLELGVYDDIPHLLTPVVVDPKQASNALRWAVGEMEERYKTLAAEGVRNIDQYNRNILHAALERREDPRPVLEERGGNPRSVIEDGEPPKPLAYIVVVIDELGDLMMVAANEVEESIARLAQMARAVGIHLILATQRPSVDVITGLIKANLPSRISFRVASKIDSRTILDANGAEQLLGRGDMLFLPPASSRFIRLHGPYISEQESARLASYLRKQGKPVYDRSITEEDKTAADAVEMDKDDLYDEAARIVVQTGQASISYLQRRLRIGFSRAARLVDMMEMEGLVSPAAGGKPREVLVAKDYFDEVDAQLR